MDTQIFLTVLFRDSSFSIFALEIFLLSIKKILQIGMILLFRRGKWIRILLMANTSIMILIRWSFSHHWIICFPALSHTLISLLSVWINNSTLLTLTSIKYNELTFLINIYFFIDPTVFGDCITVVITPFWPPELYCILYRDFKLLSIVCCWDLTYEWATLDL